MSKSSRKVGLTSARGLIEHADKSYCADIATNVLGWTTDDLADFVQGIIEAGVMSLSELRPENVRHSKERDGRQVIVQEFVDLTHG